nr:hypothetical protein [uncultured organism]
MFCSCDAFVIYFNYAELMRTMHDKCNNPKTLKRLDPMMPLTHIPTMHRMKTHMTKHAVQIAAYVNAYK